MKRGLLSVAVSFCLILSVLGIGIRVNAAETDHLLGDFKVKYDNTIGAAEFDAVNSLLKITKGGDYEISLNSVASTEQGILVTGGGMVILTLNGVLIDRSVHSDKAAFEIKKDRNDGFLVIILNNINELISGKNRSGLENNTEFGEDQLIEIRGPGTLRAVGGENGAGIGGANGKPSGRIDIWSGIIIAIGGKDGAGIGGGNGGEGGDIFIKGEEDVFVFADGGENAAGIGGGNGGKGRSITINTGIVKTQGGKNGAGIGGGTGKANSGMIIRGGTIYARGGEGAADIGGGFGSELSESIGNRILGGSVDARADKVYGLPPNSPQKPYVYTFAGNADKQVKELKSALAVRLLNTDSVPYLEDGISTDSDGKTYLWHVEKTQDKNTMELEGNKWVSDVNGNMSMLKPPVTPPPLATQGGIPIEKIKDVIDLNPTPRVTASTSDQKKTDAAKSGNQQLPATGASESGAALTAALVLAIAGLFIFKKK